MSTATETAPEAAAPQAPKRKLPLPPRIRRWVDDPNPILVKELRSILRTKLFIRFLYLSTGLVGLIVIAFGGGILLGAVAMVLVPEGVAHMAGTPWALSVVMAGGLVFFGLERALGLRRREAPQLTGMILDYVPEAIALGGLVATGSTMAPLLALLIGLQNLPEGFNSYRELAAHGARAPKTILRTIDLLNAVNVIGQEVRGGNYGRHDRVAGNMTQA